MRQINNYISALLLLIYFNLPSQNANSEYFKKPITQNTNFSPIKSEKDLKDYNYFQAKKKLFEEEGLNKYLVKVLFCEAKACIYIEDYKKANSLLGQTISISKKENYPKILSKALITQGELYTTLKEYQKALDATHDGLKVATDNNYLGVINNGYLALSIIYQNINRYGLSNDYLNKHIKLSDSLRLAKKESVSSEKRNKVLINNQSEKLKETKKELDEEKDKNSLNTLISVLSVALITILSLLTLSLYKNNNIRLKTNNMLHKKNRELIKAKEKAELASKTKANFLSTVTHELRTPLYAVTGLSNMLLDEDPKPEQIKHLKALKFSGDYLLTFINDILQINKIEANKVDVESEPFNLRKKINNILLALTNSALDNNVKFHFEYDENLPENFLADQLKISQILINLIGNSIKFTKDGDIWIRVYKIAEENKIFTLRFEIEDSGIGISKERQEHMFESFSQESIQINRKYGGTGLGLSIVKGLIKVLKGKIDLKSKLGKGTTFFFEIPLEYIKPEEIQETTPSFANNIKDLDLTKIKILVVEDNKINQMITKNILKKMNLSCELTDNGEDALKMVKENDYDIVLMDIHMPGMSGMEVTKHIRTFDKELTIFALTAVTIEDKMPEFDEAGFTDIIPKPFKQEEFDRKLFKALISNNKTKSN